MSGNPFAPPGAPVADITSPDEPAGRPPEVVRAVGLLWLNYAIGIIVMIISWNYQTTLSTPMRIWIQQFLGFLLALWVYHKIYEGRNWARILHLVIVLLSIAGSVLAYRFIAQMLSSAPAMVKASLLLSPMLNLYIVWLLFFTPGRKWFA
jgi:hypothetical protein